MQHKWLQRGKDFRIFTVSPINNAHTLDSLGLRNSTEPNAGDIKKTTQKSMI